MRRKSSSPIQIDKRSNNATTDLENNKENINNDGDKILTKLSKDAIFAEIEDLVSRMEAEGSQDLLFEDLLLVTTTTAHSSRFDHDGDDDDDVSDLSSIDANSVADSLCAGYLQKQGMHRVMSNNFGMMTIMCNQSESDILRHQQHATRNGQEEDFDELDEFISSQGTTTPSPMT